MSRKPAAAAPAPDPKPDTPIPAAADISPKDAPEPTGVVQASAAAEAAPVEQKQPVPLSFVEPDPASVEITIISTVVIDNVEVRGGKVIVTGGMADDLVRAGAATRAPTPEI